MCEGELASKYLPSQQRREAIVPSSQFRVPSKASSQQGKSAANGCQTQEKVARGGDVTGGCGGNGGVVARENAPQNDGGCHFRRGYLFRLAGKRTGGYGVGNMHPREGGFLL